MDNTRSKGRARMFGRSRRQGLCDALGVLGAPRQRFPRPLKYPLGSNVCPRTSGHLSVHYETLLLEFVEVVPRGPLGNNHTVDDQYSRGQSVSLENRDRLAALNEKGLILFKFL